MRTPTAPEEFERAYNDAVSLNRHQHPREAVTILEKLEAIGLHRPAIVGMLGTILLYDLDEVDRALPRLRESVALSPRSEVSSLALFHALMRKGKRALAMDEARRFLGLRSSAEYLRVLNEIDAPVAGESNRERVPADRGRPAPDALETPRLSCFLLVDTSPAVEPFQQELCQGLRSFKTWLVAHPSVRRRLDLVLVTFGGYVGLATNFSPVVGFTPPRLEGASTRALGAALQFAAESIESQVETYRAKGIPHQSPWVVLLTSGGSEGEPKVVVTLASERIHVIRARRGANVYPVVVADHSKPAEIESMIGLPTLQLRNGDFPAFFDWLAEGLAWATSAPVTAPVSASAVA